MNDTVNKTWESLLQEIHFLDALGNRTWEKLLWEAWGNRKGEVEIKVCSNGIYLTQSQDGQTMLRRFWNPNENAEGLYDHAKDEACTTPDIKPIGPDVILTDADFKFTD